MFKSQFDLNADDSFQTRSRPEKILAIKKYLSPILQMYLRFGGQNFHAKST